MIEKTYILVQKHYWLNHNLVFWWFWFLQSDSSDSLARPQEKEEKLGVIGPPTCGVWKKEGE